MVNSTAMAAVATKRLIAKSGRRVAIVYTGAPTGGEAARGAVLGSGGGVAVVPPLISHAQVPPLDPMAVRRNERSLVSVSVDLRELDN